MVLFMDLSKESIDFNTSLLAKLEEINAPLQDNFGIFLFTYRRLNKDGTLLHLTTQKNWVEQSVQQNLLISSEIAPKIVQTIEDSKRSFLWSGNLSDPLYNSLYEFNIWNGITFYQNYDSYIEIVAFATTRENTQASDFYINNLDLLDYYKSYFKEKTNHIICSENFKKLSKNVQDKIPIFQTNQNTLRKNLKFINETKPNRFYFSGNYEHIYLTRREAETLFYVAQGMSCKRIAIALENGNPDTLSNRTVECHWNSIKSKFKNYTKTEIVNIFLKSDIYNQILYLNKFLKQEQKYD